MSTTATQWVKPDPGRPVRVPVSPQCKRKVSRCDSVDHNGSVPASKRTTGPAPLAGEGEATAARAVLPPLQLAPSPHASPRAQKATTSGHPPTTGLLHLPNEILLEIAGYLPERPLNALLRSSRALHALLTITLYKLGKDIEYCDQHRLLHWGAEKGLYHTVYYVLEAGADANAVSHPRGHFPLHSDGLSPLHLAISLGHTRIARLLLSRGARTKCWDKDGNTPLHLAVSKKHHTIIGDLIRAGAKLTSRDSMGQRPLHLAVLAGDRRAVRLLLAAGASVAPLDHTGGTALHLAAGLAGRGIVAQLLAAGADVAGRDKEGLAPLHWAAYTGRLETVAALVRAGADVHMVDGGGRTPLHWAAEGEDEAVWAYLVKCGADKSVQDKSGARAELWKKVGEAKRKRGAEDVAGDVAAIVGAIQAGPR
ncbi:ankyrin repeat-containing domain protein [Geopyxis carbonaria]|nr:ankyrin repeat-containing domain protein [Geopyxis carbonaria]